MNKNFVLYDNYTISFNELKERNIVKQYYLLNEQDQILKIICDQSKNVDIDGSPELISELHCLNKKYKSSNNFLTSSRVVNDNTQSKGLLNNKVYFYLDDVIPLNPAKQYTFRLLDADNNTYYCKDGISVTLTFTEN